MTRTRGPDKAPRARRGAADIAAGQEAARLARAQIDAEPVVTPGPPSHPDPVPLVTVEPPQRAQGPRKPEPEPAPEPEAEPRWVLSAWAPDVVYLGDLGSGWDGGPLPGAWIDPADPAVSVPTGRPHKPTRPYNRRD